MKRFCITLILCLSLAACGGIPLRSIPKLMQLSNELLDADPAQFMVALQVDARMVPPLGAVPLLHMKLEPREKGAFEVVDKKLPLQVAVASANQLGLEAPGKGRNWLLYSLPPSTQLELQRVQSTIKRFKAEANGKKVGSLSIGVEQDSLTPKDSALAHTRWETWLQTKQRDGFFEVWSGTLAQLHKLAAEQR
jgi:hypothetical protein